MRRAKIVCTVGPATEKPDKVLSLVQAGMDVARINRSHGEQSEHEAVVRNVREAAEQTGRNVAVLVDLQGPKIRLETFLDGPVELKAGQTFTITADDVEGTAEIVGTTHKGLSNDVRPGEAVLIDDGKVGLRVTKIDGPRVVTVVEVPGVVSDHKGINLPGAAVSVPSLSDKDEDDLRWALRIGVDLIALSFVREAGDIEGVHRIMRDENRFIPVIAKIEKPLAVTNLRDIVDAFDGCMVARGDLGVELPLEQVPLVQKSIIELCRRQAKPVIVATQMLESMTDNPRPTRAEVSDVANAILDGTDAVMLSGETSVGEFPTTTVATMSRIVEYTERHGRDRLDPLGRTPHSSSGAITHAAAEIGLVLGAKYVATFTQTGDSARRMSRLRHSIPLLAFTPAPSTRAQLALSWGTETMLVPDSNNSDEMVNFVDQRLREDGLADEGDVVVVVSGAPPGIAGTTNNIRVHTLGDSVETAEAHHSDM